MGKPNINQQASRVSRLAFLFGQTPDNGLPRWEGLGWSRFEYLKKSGPTLRFVKDPMKFKFSIKRLFFITTVVAVLLGFAAWVEMFSSDWRMLAVLCFYFLIYLSIIAVFFGPRYLREWKEFRANVRSQRLVREELESAAEKTLAAIETDGDEA